MNYFPLFGINDHSPAPLPGVAARASVKGKGFSGHGIYLVDSFGNKDLLHKDPAITCMSPIPVAPRRCPPLIPHQTAVGLPCTSAKTAAQSSTRRSDGKTPPHQQRLMTKLTKLTKLTRSIVLLALALGATALGQPIPANGKLKIFILSGQSNMIGIRATRGQPGDHGDLSQEQPQGLWSPGR